MKITGVLALALLVSLPAHADDTGAETVVTYGALGLAGAIVNVGFTVYDLAHLVSGEPVPKSVALVETLYAIPQMAISAYLFTNPPPADGVRGLEIAWFVWATALAAHGVWSLARPTPPPPPVEVGVRLAEEPRIVLAPPLWTAAARF